MRRDEQIRDALPEVCSRHGVADLYVFGSRAREIAALVRGGVAAEMQSSSDVDIGVRPEPDRYLGLDDVVALADELEQLFGVSRVDVVVLPAAGAFLALEVIRGELLYCADRHAQAEYEVYVLARAGDLAPFQKARQDLALSRYIDR